MGHVHTEEDSTIVIVGGAGYIGCWLARQLLDEGYHVRIVDNFLFGDFGLPRHKRSRLEVVEADICDTKAVSSAIKGAETVILLAAIVGHRAQDVKWTNTRNINFFASTVVLDAAIEHGAHRFIFASTNSVYGLQSGVMYETAIPEPVSLYSRLKLRMEERVINSKRSGFHPTALRIATCHGYSPRMRFDLVLNSMVRDAVCKGEITVENGEQCRALIHVQDAAQAFVTCIKAHENMISGEVFNVGDPEQNLKVTQLANLVKTHIPETKITVHDGEPDLLEYRLSCSKLEKLLDFKPAWSLDASVCQMRDMFKEERFSDPYSLRYSNT